MIKAHKIRLDPTNKQAGVLDRTAHTARAAYNIGLDLWRDMYEASQADPEAEKPTVHRVKKLLNSRKRAEYPWMYEVTKCATQEALLDLGRAFSNFFKGTARYPKRKKRGKTAHSYRVTNDKFTVNGKRIRLPNVGWVRMRENLRFQGKLLSATVSHRAGRWYVSVSVDVTEAPQPAPPGSATGIDLGVGTYAVLADGSKTVTAPPMRRQQSRLRRLNRELHRRKPGSKNRAKTRTKLARLHDQVAARRRDAQHKFTTDIARHFQLVGVEDLNVAGMLANHHLAGAIADRGFHETRRQLDYKVSERGGRVVAVDRWFPSSKLCSTCGFKNHELTLAIRYWTCGSCGTTHDRDVNAAVNIKNEALRLVGGTTAGSAVAACGGEGTGQVVTDLVEPAPVKQELSATPA